MANAVYDEGWEEDIEEILEEGVEEEEEQLPAGYLAADGPYKHFCTCQDNVTCNFCSWFHLIRECQVHGKATKRPPKPCYCHKRGSFELQGSSTGQQVKSLRSQLSYDSHLETCDCRKTTFDLRCDCLDEIPSSSVDSACKDGRPSDHEGTSDGVHGEDVVDGRQVVDEDEESEDVDGDFKNISIPERQQAIQAGRQPPTVRPCTCAEEPVPRSGSSTELESSVFESSDSDSSSQYDLDIFGNLKGSSSNITSSENSSAEGADIDWTRVRWIHNASDRSVESVSDDDYEERKRRRAADKKLKARPRRRRHIARKKTDKSRYQYLVVQQSRKKNFLEICKDKKDQPHSYSYRLMNII